MKKAESKEEIHALLERKAYHYDASRGGVIRESGLGQVMETKQEKRREEEEDEVERSQD